jgi:hypothetical protein
MVSLALFWGIGLAAITTWLAVEIVTKWDED